MTPHSFWQHFVKIVFFPQFFFFRKCARQLPTCILPWKFAKLYPILTVWPPFWGSWMISYFGEKSLAERHLFSSRCPIIPVTSKVECPRNSDAFSSFTPHLIFFAICYYSLIAAGDDKKLWRFTLLKIRGDKRGHGFNQMSSPCTEVQSYSQAATADTDPDPGSRTKQSHRRRSENQSTRSRGHIRKNDYRIWDEHGSKVT